MSSFSPHVVDPAHAPELGTPGGPSVVLAVTPAARGRGWVESTARALASSWSRATSEDPVTVILVDADFAVPTLEPTEGPPRPGLGDLLAGDGSPEDLLLPGSEPSVLVLPAGSFPADPYGALSGPRWDALARRLRRDDGLLVTLVPLGEPWCLPILSDADQLMILGVHPEDVGAASAAVTTPAPILLAPGGDTPPEPEVEGGDEAAGEPPREPDPDHRPTPRPAEAARPDPPAAERGHGGRRGDPEPPGPTDGERESRLPLLLASLLVLGGAMALFAWLGPGTPAPTDSPRVPAVAPEPDPATTEEAPPDAPPPAFRPRFALRLGSFSDPENARALQGAVVDAAPTTWVGIAPVEVAGVVYHRVLGGLAADSMAAEELRPVLSEALGESGVSWLAEPAPLAYRTLTTDVLSSAEEEAARIRALGLPAYVLEETRNGEGIRFRVFVGAYPTLPETAHLARLLDEQGVEGEWSERVGRRPR